MPERTTPSGYPGAVPPVGTVNRFSAHVEGINHVASRKPSVNQPFQQNLHIV